MTLAAIGAENIILNGNPKKTFFKAKYNIYPLPILCSDDKTLFKIFDLAIIYIYI